MRHAGQCPRRRGQWRNEWGQSASQSGQWVFAGGQWSRAGGQFVREGGQRMVGAGIGEHPAFPPLAQRHTAQTASRKGKHLSPVGLFLARLSKPAV